MTTESTPNIAGEGTTPAPVVVPPVAIETKPAPVAPAVKPAPAAEPATPDVPEDADDDSLERFTDKDGNIKMPFRAFKSRLARAPKKTLKEIFGTDDREAILAQKAEFEKMVSEKEKTRRAQLDELEREREDRKKAEERATKLERQLAKRDRDEQAAAAARELTDSATKVISSSYAEYALADFKKHINTKSDEEIDAMSQDDIDKFFTDWVEKRPETKRGGAPKSEEKKPVQKVAISNGAPPGNRPSPPKSGEDALNGKTPRPGQPNSMNAAELAEYKRRTGRSW